MRSDAGDGGGFRTIGVTMALVALLIFAACSSSDDGASAVAGDATAPSNNDAADSDGSDTDASEDATSGDETATDDPSDNSAMVVIDGTTYAIAASQLNLCNSLDNLIFGSFAVDSSGAPTAAGGPDAAIQVNFGIPLPEWEDQGLQAPTLNVDLLDDGIRWFASMDLGSGSVDSWELDDGRAVGNASFVGQEVGSGAEVGAGPGTFDIVCR